MMNRWLAVVILVALSACAQSVGAQDPSLVLKDGGLEFHDGTIQETSAVVANPPPALTVAVDCDGGDSIHEALQQPADVLTIEISGICTEHVVVDRSNVIFRGSDPSSDGLQGAITGESYQGLVEVRGGVTDVEFENLTFRNSEARGIYVRNSGRVKISNCWLIDNDSIGFQTARGYGWILDSRFAGNGKVVAGYGGARVSGAGRLICQRCVFENNGGWGLTSVEGAYVWLDESTVSDLNGVFAGRAGMVEGTGSSITAEAVAIGVGNGGDITWSDSEIVGGFWVGPKALLSLNRVEVVQASDYDNVVSGDSTVELDDSVVPGVTNFETFSNGSARGSETVIGTLDCDNGGDFSCFPDVTVGSSTCALCPLPE